PEAGGELLLVEQFRHGNDASTLEVIGGVCDPGEEPGFTARRELLEETGHEAASWVDLAAARPIRPCRTTAAISIWPRAAGPWRNWIWILPKNCGSGRPPGAR